jgi:hypothetical protein
VDDQQRHQAHEEGWYTDPYGLHEARWMDDGRPTKLVRDGDKESYEEPPDASPSRVPVRIEPPESASADDLKRADEAESDDVDTAILDAFAQHLPPT